MGAKAGKQASHANDQTIQKLPLIPRLTVATFSVFMDAARRSDGTLNRCLLSFFDLKCSANAKPRNGVSTHDVILDRIRARLFLPASPPPSPAGYPVVVFFHGGGFAFFSSSSILFDGLCRRLARKLGVVVVLVDFRRAPEHRFPAPYEDGVDVLRALNVGESKDPGVAKLFSMSDLSSCFISGDSAGANIVHHVAHRWSTDPTSGPLRLAGIIPIQPFFGGEAPTESEIRLANAPMVNNDRTDWMWKAFLPEGATRDHPAANVFGPQWTGELGKAFPPTMVVIGTGDPLMDRQRSYVEGLRERGKEVKVVEYAGAVHGFYMFPEVKESGVLIEEMKEFITKYSSNGESN